MSCLLVIFESFENENYIYNKDLPLLRNYIYKNLNSWLPNKAYWQRQLNITTKMIFVSRWRRENGLRPLAKKGEAICNNEVVNFFVDEKHRNCTCSKI